MRREGLCVCVCGGGGGGGDSMREFKPGMMWLGNVYEVV